MHITDLDACLGQVGRQVLSHFFGQCSHQHPLLPGGSGVDLPNQVIDLPFNGADLHHRIQ